MWPGHDAADLVRALRTRTESKYSLDNSMVPDYRAKISLAVLTPIPMPGHRPRHCVETGTSKTRLSG